MHQAYILCKCSHFHDVGGIYALICSRYPRCPQLYFFQKQVFLPPSLTTHPLHCVLAGDAAVTGISPISYLFPSHSQSFCCCPQCQPLFPNSRSRRITPRSRRITPILTPTKTAHQTIHIHLFTPPQSMLSSRPFSKSFFKKCNFLVSFSKFKRFENDSIQQIVSHSLVPFLPLDYTFMHTVSTSLFSVSLPKTLLPLMSAGHVTKLASIPFLPSLTILSLCITLSCFFYF